MGEHIDPEFVGSGGKHSDPKLVEVRRTRL